MHHLPASNLDEVDCRPTEGTLNPEVNKHIFSEWLNVCVLGHETLFHCSLFQNDATGVAADSIDENKMIDSFLSGSESQSSVSSRTSSAAGFHSDSSRPDSSLGIEVSLSVCSDSRPVTPADSSRAASASSNKQPPISNIFSDFGVVDPVEDLEIIELPLDCVNSCLDKLRSMLPRAWLPICDRNSFHFLLLSDSTPKAIQREVIISFQGVVSINIHCENIFSNQILTKIPIPRVVSEDLESVLLFCEKCVCVVKELMNYDVCVGANHENTKKQWSIIAETYIDRNPYQERNYVETCRSLSCLWLVSVEKGKAPRCENCTAVFYSLKRRENVLTAEETHPCTPNMFLTPDQAALKLKIQHEEIRRKDKRISYLESKLQEMLDKEGVDIEDDLSVALRLIFKSAQLTEIQKLFLEMQIKNAQVSDKRLHRWHPTMIRLALHIKSKMTNSGYEGLRDSGAILLPSARTLFDYSHAIEAQEGISDEILKLVSERVNAFEKEYQKYHVLLADEIYISQNLVFRGNGHKDGEADVLLGYARLDDVEKELLAFEGFIESKFTGKEQEEKEPELAKTMLTYMVKGVASDVKYVVAGFPVKTLTADTMYAKTWQVISRLEKANVKIIALICDGAPTNRAFIAMHEPLTKVKSKVVFDTLNFASPEERPLFFLSDVCHLIKTIRNCLYNSGENRSRHMEKNGQKLQWKTIVRLYLTFKDTNFRKSFKLNTQNVYPNKFSCMSVRNAALVLSDTVAQDIEDQEWEGTEELVKFIRYINKFFDCLNGAFSGQTIKTRNKNLAPYTSATDERFDWLGVPHPDHQNVINDKVLEKPFLKYLEEWKEEVQALPIHSKKKEKMLLAHQTLHGIEMSIRGFAGAVRYLFENLDEPPKFIMARVFSQDPLEQHFSKQRGACGGSNNPNAAQFNSTVVACAVERDMGVKHRRSNSAEVTREGMEITNEPLPKRKRK